MKELVAKVIADRVKDGETIGLGSGSTAELAIVAIGKRVKNEKISILGVPTSPYTAQLAESAGVRVLSSSSMEKIDWAFDGADEIDPNFNLIKGKGGAMLLEKIIARRAGGITVVATEDKLVQNLGSKFPLPVEVIPAAQFDVAAELRKLGATEVVPRIGSGKFGLVVTDCGNYILDVRFTNLVPALEMQIKELTGVVESGLFCGLTREVLVAKKGGVYSVKPGGNFEGTLVS